MTPGERVQSLAALIEGTSIGLLELTGPDGVLRLRRGAASQCPEPEASEPVDEMLGVVPAPSLGTFRVRHPLQEGPLAGVGDQVEAGDVIGLIQVGSLLLHVRAPSAGVLAAVIAEDGTVVGYGTPLFQIAEKAQ